MLHIAFRYSTCSVFAVAAAPPLLHNNCSGSALHVRNHLLTKKNLHSTLDLHKLHLLLLIILLHALDHLLGAGGSVDVLALSCALVGEVTLLQTLLAPVVTRLFLSANTHEYTILLTKLQVTNDKMELACNS